MNHHPGVLLLAVYWVAGLSNLGPFGIYTFVMLKTAGRLRLPAPAVLGARNFFFGCAMTHVVMLVAMPVGM